MENLFYYRTPRILDSTFEQTEPVFRTSSRKDLMKQIQLNFLNK